jgi:hypothetical protein
VPQIAKRWASRQYEAKFEFRMISMYYLKKQAQAIELTIINFDNSGLHPVLARTHANSE